MEHFLSNLSQGNMKAMTAGKSYTTTDVSEKNTISPTNILELKPGQSFKGEIIAVNGEEVQLLLAQNQYLTARLEGQVQLSLGQSLLFKVQSNEAAKIILKPMYESAFQLHVNESALKAANLPINDRNMQLVSVMIENGLPIDKETLAVFHRQILQNPQISLENLVKMNKLQIPLTQENVFQFESYQNFQNSLSKAIDEVAQDIVQMCDSLSYESNQAEKYINELFNFLKDSEKSYFEMPQSEDVSTKSMNIQEVQEIEKQPLDIRLDKGTKEDTLNLIENEKYIRNESAAEILTDNEMQEASQGGALNKIVAAITGTLKNRVAAAENTIQDLTYNDGADIHARDMDFIANMFKELSVDEKKQIVSNKLFKDFLKASLKDLWALSPDEVSQPGKIQELYARIVRQSKKLAQIVDEAAMGGQTQTKSINNLRENIEFINHINHTFQYVQLPIKFSNQNANGELFVYANKKSIAQNGENLSAILHLDLEHLGKIDIKIQLQTKREFVNTSFYIDSSMISFLEQHLSELNERLEKLGFRTKTKVLELEKPKTVIEEMEELALGGSVPLSYQSFDMRT